MHRRHKPAVNRTLRDKAEQRRLLPRKHQKELSSMRKVLPVLFLLLISIAMSPAMALGTDDTRDAELAHYDKELNDVFGRILKKLDAKGQQKLRAAQRAWIQMRDADCEWAFVDKYDCLIDRTIIRTKELKESDFESKSGRYGSVEHPDRK